MLVINLTDSAVMAINDYWQDLYNSFPECSTQTIFRANIILITALIMGAYWGKSRSKKNLTTQEVAKINSKRKYGHWTPDLDFTIPIPKPYQNWDIKTTTPLPYRAFRDKYTITMGIRNMNWEEWIELDNEWLKYHNAKLKRLEEKGTDLYETLPLARNAVFELLEELWRYLPNRYPSLFKQTIRGIDNIVTGESHCFKEGYRTNDDPILMVAKLLQDDVAIMMEDENGEYILKAGAIILPGFWRFRDKFNLTLNKIHSEGHVPKYKEKLQNGMEKFFIRQAVDKPVVRNNYFIQTDDQLGWSSSIGDEAKENVGWYTADEAQTVDQIYLRSERQSLRRLPKTGAIVFTVRTYFLPITKLANEPYVARRLYNGINSWEPSVRDYRGLSKFENVLLPYLDQVATEQEKQGMTTDENYRFPF